MESIVQDQDLSLDCLLDVWDCLDESEKERAYYYAIIHDKRWQRWALLAITFLLVLFMEMS